MSDRDPQTRDPQTRDPRGQRPDPRQADPRQADAPGSLAGTPPTLGDMPVEDFRRAAHRAVDLVADYLDSLEERPVLPDIRPGDVRRRLASAAPEEPDPIETILEDYRTRIQPDITHWQHPGFMAYFPSVASGPGILGELLAAGLNSNVMLWRNAPASTELEQTVVDWLRQLLGLPERFSGMFTDTASVASLLALVAARHAVPGWAGRQRGWCGPEAPRLRAYASTEAHSSIDKAALTIGIGTDGLRRVATDDALGLCPAALAAAIDEDVAAGWTPFCIVGTIGTTSTTAVDPAAALADLAERHGLWLHVDAAYAGAAAILPEARESFRGWERADSIVFNLHKWFWTPFDATLLLFPRPEAFRDAFSLVPEYLQTSVEGDAVNFNEYGIQLGRRFRALKVWMQLRYFGAEGMRRRLRAHLQWAGELREWVDAAPDWEALAPTAFATVCFRCRPPGLDEESLNRLNADILERVNRTGRFFLSHAVVRGRYALRVVVGNPRQTRAHVAGCWDALRHAAAESRAESG